MSIEIRANQRLFVRTPGRIESGQEHRKTSQTCMSITGSMQLVGKIEELERRVSALETEKVDLLARFEKLSREFTGLRMRAGRKSSA